MGSGLSMTSVNKIKELAAAREYSLALEIIDSQDLSKSLNPQFIRLCGDVYIANKRYKDARKVLLMAHRMAPEAKRVIYSLVDLYLRMGYKDLAEFYYNLYMFDAEPNLPQTNHMNYIYNKAQGCPPQEIETLLFPVYSDEMDYDWSYELYLLMKLQGKEGEAKSIKSDYAATFKNEPNVLLMEELEQSDDKLEDLFYIYSKDNVADDSPDQEELRQEEKALMEADDLRMNPKEAEIQILFDYSEKATFGAKLKYKRHMKEQEKLARTAEKDGVESGDDGTSETALDVDNNSEEIMDESDDITNEEQQESDASETTGIKVNIFKKLFSRKKNEDVEDIVSEETDNLVKTENQEEQIQEINSDESQQAEESVSDDESIDEEEAEADEMVKPVETTALEEESSQEYDLELEDKEDMEGEDISTSEKAEFDEESVSLDDKEVDAATEDESEQEATEDIGDSVMQEIYGKKKISIVTEVGEDTFINTQDFDSSNPFDEIINQNKKSDDEEKSSFVFEEVQLQPEDDSEYEIDDFTDDFEVSDFNDEIDDAGSDSSVESVEEILDIDDKNSEYEFDLQVPEEQPMEQESETVEYQEDLEESEAKELQEASEESVTEELQEPEAEEYQSEYEELEVDEYQTGYDKSTVVGIQDEYQDSVDEDAIEEKQNLEFDNGKIDAMASLERESVYNSLKEKGSMDFPEFRTTLFPEYGQEVIEVENNFNEIMSEAQDKINENLMKEEQMQREAEALLASLGIDLGTIEPTIKPEEATLGFDKNVENTPITNLIEESPVVQPPQRVDEQLSEPIQETVNDYSPSRDELKSSLKIDSVKKNILKQIKEYR